RLGYLVVAEDAVPDQVRGDAVHRRQVLLNLVGNAVKFADSGRVRIDVSVIGAGEAQVVRLRFVVSDTGIGIPESMRHRLFEAFEQADAGLARRYGGTGLGTTIARGLVEAMGGRIGYENLEPRGSRFWFEVPFQPARPARHAAVLDAGQHGAGGDGKVIAFADPFLRHRARVRSMQVL